ncbi:hypothetical protein V6N12_060150 [Hibiscus sabdariffa]|uniref:RNase H type-1 domain-containing protein n=1 Tax=Hibiscus sabdariffa TaxID=183260 RepID=A0ABR2D3L1_9ROSI
MLRERNGRILPSSILGSWSKAKVKGVHGLKGSHKSGSIVKKRDERGSATTALASCVSSLVSELNQVMVPLPQSQSAMVVHDSGGMVFSGAITWLSTNKSLMTCETDLAVLLSPVLRLCLLPRLRLAAAGGVIRDDQGGWIYGCACHIGRCYVLMAELWATHDILLAAWNLGFHRIQFETDWRLLGFSKMQNMVADRVVALCRDSLSSSMVFDSVPAALAELVRKEVVSF